MRSFIRPATFTVEGFRRRMYCFVKPSSTKGEGAYSR